MLSTQERLSYCIVCQNREFDPNKGLVCGLTLLSPTFEESCQDYKEDEKRKEDLTEKSTDYFSDDIVSPVAASTRFVNFLVDRIAIIAFAFVFGFFIAETELGDIFLASDSRIMDYIFGAIVSTIYYTIIEASTGKSLGKLVTKTVVVREDGTKPEFGDYFVRSVVRIIPFEAFSFFGDGIGWHDTFSKTRVVKTDSLKTLNSEEILDDFTAE